MAAYWKKAEGENNETARLMNSIPKLVFSKTLKKVDWDNTTLINGDASAEISKLKAQGGKDMYVMGSADLSRTFINENLIDEYRLCIAPSSWATGGPCSSPVYRHGI